MMTENTGLSAADVIALNGNRNNDGMWGDGAWIWVILALAVLGGGWGFGGFGGFGGGAYGGALTEAQLCNSFNFNGLENGVRGIQQGICDSTYALNNSIIGGFAGVQQTLCQGFNGINTGILQNSYNTQAGFNSLSHQLSDCCCDIERGIDRVNYNIATTSCATNTAISNAARDITDNANSNTRAILDFIIKDKIDTLQAENTALKFKASQAEQNAFITANQQAQTAELIRRLGADCPTPAYVVQPPTAINWPINSCNTFSGYNGGCGC